MKSLIALTTTMPATLLLTPAAPLPLAGGGFQ